MGSNMRWKNILSGFVIFAALIISGFLYLDLKLAEFVSEKSVPFSFLGDRIRFAGPFVLNCVHRNSCELGRALVAGKKNPPKAG